MGDRRSLDRALPARAGRVSPSARGHASSEDQLLDVQRLAGNRAATAVAMLVQREGEATVVDNPLYESPWTDNPLFDDTPSLMDDRAGSEPTRPDPVLPGKVRAILEGKAPFKLARLKSLIKGYDDLERNAVSGDAALMQLAQDKLGTQEYITLLTVLAVIAPGVTPTGNPHTSAQKADELIRDKLGDYLKKAIKAGRQVQGSVAVVKGADWTLAYEAEFGKNDPTEPSTNAFVDKKNRIIIHAERGNPGTTIHEGVHKYALDNFLSTNGFDLNEGVTEFFTRKITESLDTPIARTNYQENFEVATALAALVGEGVLAKAYFDGDLSGLMSAWKAKGKTKADWKAFVKAMREERYADAEAML